MDISRNSVAQRPVFGANLRAIVVDPKNPDYIAKTVKHVAEGLGHNIIIDCYERNKEADNAIKKATQQGYKFDLVYLSRSSLKPGIKEAEPPVNNDEELLELKRFTHKVFSKIKV